MLKSIDKFKCLLIVIQLSAARIVEENLNQTLTRHHFNVHNVFSNHSVNSSSIRKDYQKFAEGIVSIDCMRCMCLLSSNCEDVGCRLVYATKICGYFKLSVLQWIDCDKPGKDFPSCANDFYCSSLCVQRYIKRYVKPGNCPAHCEGYSRLLFGGPGGCDSPRTLKTWNVLQQEPGCKGVQ